MWWQSVIAPSRRRGSGDTRVPVSRNLEREKPIMSLANHLEELQRKHGDIEREIDEAMLHPSVDDLEIAKLKRRKLALKDEIEKLKAQPTTH
jgi:hypothetical protein